MPRKKVEVVDETKNIALALKALCEDKGLPTNVVVDAMSEALKKAYFKFSGDYPDTIIKVDIDLNTGNIKMAKIKNVVAEIEDDVFETDPEEAFEETGKVYLVGDVVETPIDISLFRRAAAMQAKSVFKQKLREAEKQLVVDQFSDKVGDVLSGIVDAVEARHCIVKIANHTNAYLSKNNMLPNETFKIGSPIKVYVEEVDKAATGAPVIVSRTNPRFVTRLMEQDISDIAEGVVEIKGVSRQPGSRSKVAVYSKNPNVDPSGACIGPHGSRIARVLAQIGNERIDVVNYNENPLLYVADALKPAVVIGIQVLDEQGKACRAIVADDQYSLAIGKEAQNVNLAVRLTGWKIDIKSTTDAEENGYEYQLIEDLKFMEQARKSRSSVVAASKPVVEEVPVIEEEIEEVEETPVVEETKVEEVKPVKVEKVVETKVEEEVIKVKPTKSKTPNMFSELEAALNASSSQEEKQPTKKKSYKKNVEKEDEEEKVEVKKSTYTNVVPVYTEEELRAIQEAEEAEEASRYDDDDIDYDEFDEYYDED